MSRSVVSLRLEPFVRSLLCSRRRRQVTRTRLTVTLPSPLTLFFHPHDDLHHQSSTYPLQDPRPCHIRTVTLIKTFLHRIPSDHVRILSTDRVSHSRSYEGGVSIKIKHLRPCFFHHTYLSFVSFSPTRFLHSKFLIEVLRLLFFVLPHVYTLITLPT